MYKLSLNEFIICESCKSEFTRKNYPITLSCGHNYCKRCLSCKDLNQNALCSIDSITSKTTDNPNIDFINLIELARGIPELNQAMMPKSVYGLDRFE